VGQPPAFARIHGDLFKTVVTVSALVSPVQIAVQLRVRLLLELIELFLLVVVQDVADPSIVLPRCLVFRRVPILSRFP